MTFDFNRAIPIFAATPIPAIPPAMAVTIMLPVPGSRYENMDIRLATGVASVPDPSLRPAEEYEVCQTLRVVSIAA